MPDRYACMEEATFIRISSLAVAVAAMAHGAGWRTLQAQTGETVYEVTSPVWYEDAARFFRVSPDGRRAQFGSGPLVRHIDLAGHVEFSRPPQDSLLPPRDTTYELRIGPDGLSTLVRMTRGTPDTIRSGLDGAWAVNLIARSRDAKTLYLALA